MPTQSNEVMGYDYTFDKNNKMKKSNEESYYKFR